MTPYPGAEVHVAMTKWGDRPHWSYDATYLGEDEHGEWLGIPAGTSMTRPGRTYVAPVAQVCLVPGPGPATDRGWWATFHAPGGPCHTYVDVTTPPRWHGLTLGATDLDLDVVRGTTGRVWIDDEDEFVEHQTEFGYPAVIISFAVETCERVEAAVRSRTVPYDGPTAAHWFDALATWHR